MFKNNSLFRRITKSYVDNPCERKGTVYTYPAIVVDTGNDYSVSSIVYDDRNTSQFEAPFSITFNYAGQSLAESGVVSISLYTHVEGVDDNYAFQYIPGTIFEKEDLNDFCLFLYKDNGQKMANSRYCLVMKHQDKKADLYHSVSEKVENLALLSLWERWRAL